MMDQKPGAAQWTDRPDSASREAEAAMEAASESGP